MIATEQDENNDTVQSSIILAQSFVQSKGISLNLGHTNF